MRGSSEGKTLYWLLWTSVREIVSVKNDNHASIDCRCRGNQDTIGSGDYVPPLPHAHQLIYAKEKIIL
jgi:hypothetical protein